jgi:hypothetical protein
MVAYLRVTDSVHVVKETNFENPFVVPNGLNRKEKGRTKLFYRMHLFENFCD